jgi:hypothetical protein
MTLKETIEACSRGADFTRADLHIHSYGDYGSYDVTDDSMTPQNIIDVAVREHLSIISVTDHNEIGNVRETMARGDEAGVTVIAGVELSTPQGHLLVYCPDIEHLEKFFGKLEISSDKKSCKETIPQCLKIAAEYRGFGIAAHIDVGAGIEKAVAGYGQFKEDILTCPNLLALEITDAANERWYTERDSNSNRKRLFQCRRNHLSNDSTYELARVLFSDAHTLSSLGVNAQGNKRLTRIKMNSPSFNAMRIALQDASARVRIEDLIPKSVPHILGATFHGGFLDGQTVHFSKNLTCIIGGRGTGKSTMLEAVRGCTGNPAKDIVDSDVGPDRISLIYEDETGRQQTLSRDKLRDVVNESDPAEGITYIPIESYGQGETAEKIQHCDKDPQVLLEFLDGFLSFGTLRSEDEAFREQLLESQTIIERLVIEVSAIPEVRKALKNAQNQLKTLKDQKAKEVVELEEALAQEKTFRGTLVDELTAFMKDVKAALKHDDIKAFIDGYDADELVVGSKEFKEVKIIVDEYIKTISQHSTDLSKNATTVIGEINAQLKSWKERESEKKSKIEEIRKTLQKDGITLDMAFIRKTAKDATEYDRKLKDLTNKQKNLKQARRERKQLVTERLSVKAKMYAVRYGFATKLESNLKATVLEYRVSVNFREGKHAPEAEDLIQEAMGWRTSQVPRAALIVNNVTVPKLLNVIDKKEYSDIEAVRNANGEKVFSAGDARAVVDTLAEPSNRMRLERCVFDDLPEITITKRITDEGTQRYVTKDFSQLSLGQQQSILLSILLYSESSAALLIDQPEDNLDSSFVYRTIVQNLRQIKEHRQVIIVTHNANIAVLGDAELIVPLKSRSDKAFITDRGSIDAEKTKYLACEILEGGEKAFRRRSEIYGIQPGN